MPSHRARGPHGDRRQAGAADSAVLYCVATEQSDQLCQSTPRARCITTPDDVIASQKKFFEAAMYPETQARLASLLQRGLQPPLDFEMRLGEHLATP